MQFIVMTSRYRDLERMRWGGFHVQKFPPETYICMYVLLYISSGNRPNNMYKVFKDLEVFRVLIGL